MATGRCTLSTDNTKAVAHGIAGAVLLLVCALVPHAAFAQAPPPGVFTEVQTAVVPRTSPALEPATMRSRVVQVDTQRITAARRGREILKLNLFDDAVVEVQIKRVRPTQNGYFISGRPKGKEWGEIRLVVNGPVMVGTVETPEGTFTIRSAGSGRHVIRQIDPSAERFDCEVEDAPLPARPQNAIASIDPPNSLAFPATPQKNDMPTEDGSEIRVLIVYTPGMQQAQGGSAGMRALIDLFVQSTNKALEESGANPRVVLAHAAMVDYVSKDISADLWRLKAPDDGYMDEVHALRNQHAADLVHLLSDVGGGGSADRLPHEAVADDVAFAVTQSSSERVFVHELGHNLGLAHDRYAYGSNNVSPIYRYAYGYVNKRALDTGAPETTRWRTIMSYADRCRDAGFNCEWLLRFSNPDQTYKDDPLGIAADDPATGVDGPADARLAINNAARWVGSFRSEACTDFTVSPETPSASIEGGLVILQVNTGHGCLWEASTQEEFFTITSAAFNAGTQMVTVEVQANTSGEERSGIVAVAGKTIAIRQPATADGVCGRTSAVLNAIKAAAELTGAARCEDVSNDDLARITTLNLQSQSIGSLKEGDFEGLSGLQSLHLDQNQLTGLPGGLFGDLSKLQELRMENNELTELPERLLAGLTNLKQLNLRNNQLTDLPERLFAGLSHLEELRLSNNRLTRISPRVFSGLSGLQLLNLDRNGLTDLPVGVFGDLSSLNELNLRHNHLTELSAGLFSGLSSLEHLWLGGNRLTNLAVGQFAGLSSLKSLSLAGNRLTNLAVGQFAGLSALEYLGFDSNFLAELSEGLFADLGALKELRLDFNQLTELPDGIFFGLSNLEYLALPSNRLTELPNGLLTGLSNLQRLRIENNQLSSLPLGLFAGLSRLNSMDLGSNQLTHLPNGLFAGLSELEYLGLSYNQLSDLPNGIFAGLVGLGALYLENNLIEPLALPLSLEKVGEDGFKAIASAGAPFEIALPVTVSSAGMIDDGANTVTIPAGAVQSAVLTVARVANAEEAVEVDIGKPPGLPGRHFGYALTKDATLPLRVLPSIRTADATLISLSLSDGRLEPAFDADTMNYSAIAVHDVATLTVTPTLSNAAAAVAFLDASDRALADSDATMDGHQVSLRTGANTIKVKVTSQDGTVAQTYTLVLTRDTAANVCSRTTQVRDAILAAVSGVDACRELTNEQLSRITVLDLTRQSISSLKPGDFAGLTALERLFLSSNELSALPSGVFSGLTALELLRLSRNKLSTLPSGVFSGLGKLEYLYLGNNGLRGLPQGIFSGLVGLKRLGLEGNELRALPADVFSGLGALESLVLSNNQLNSLPDGVFSDLAALEVLDLRWNDLVSRNLPDRVFSGLAALRELYLEHNRLTSLEEGTFSGLAALEVLNLQANQLSLLPDGVFSGLTALEALRLDGNSVDPLALYVSLSKVGDSQVKAVAPAAAPFTLELALSISSTGTIENGAGMVTIPVGAVESEPVRVMRAADTEEAVTVDIDSLPELPANHLGYSLQKDEALPLEILPGPKAPSPAQVIGVVVATGIEQLEVSWAAVPDADGYKMQWKSGDEEYNETRQVVLAGGDTNSYTITGLAAGTEHTVRVIATKENADDGPPSSEVTGTPSALPASQVTGVEVARGVEQLDVSWDALSDASGYKVQWKSGAEDYGEERQAVLTGGETVSHTITGVIADTEYTIRVIATKDNADDGPPSDEVTATPISANPDVNADGLLNGDDALAMYHSYASADQLGDGETGGTPESRQSLLAGYSGKTSPTDDDLKAMIRKANVWKAAGVDAGGDINEDGVIDESDAFVMYYAYTTANLVGDGETGGTARFRQLLLAAFANKDNPTDEDLKKMLRRANKLRGDFA